MAYKAKQNSTSVVLIWNRDNLYELAIHITSAIRPGNYAHNWRVVAYCCVFIARFFSYPAELLNWCDCSNANEETLHNIGIKMIYIYHNWQHNNNEVNHNTSVCVFGWINCVRASFWKEWERIHPARSRLIAGYVCNSRHVVGGTLVTLSAMQVFDRVPLQLFSVWKCGSYKGGLF